MKVSSLVVATLVVVAAAVIGIGHESQFVFDPETMHRVAKQAIADNPANDPQGIVDSVRSLLKKEYPDYIVDDSEWLFNNAGGAMGAMVVSSAFHSHPPRPLHELTLPLFSFPQVLHASLSEYVIIFGSPIGTEGHSGRFLSDDYFTILHGEQWAYSPGQLTKEVSAPTSFPARGKRHK